MLTTELALSASAGPQLAAQVDSSAASGVRWAVLVADGTCRVQLTGPPSLVASAEASIWRMFPGEVDVGRWTYLDARGRQHAGFGTDQLLSWRRAGYFPDALPIKNGRSTNFITLGLLLASRTTDSTNNDNMDVDVLSAAVDELAQQRETGCDTGDIRDLAMPDADPLPVPSTAIVFVVDTCTLLSSLPRLERVLEALAGATVALVPWTVIYELDGLKSSQSQEVNKLAREVTHTLERVLRQHSRWRAQSPAEDRIAAAEAERLRPSGSKVTADDKVIAAALVLRKRSIKALVLSNDTNLRVRAGVCSILALPDYAFPGTKEALDNVVASMPHVDAENSDGPSMVENAQAMTHASRSFADRSAEVLDMMQQEPCMQPMSRVSTSEAVDRALALLQTGCCDLMESAYREEFGDQFDIAVQEPPPWSGGSCAKMLARNWNAVFKQRFNRDVLLAANCVEEAVKSAMRRGGSGDPAAALAVVTHAYDLLQALPADGAGAGPLLHARGDLDALRRQLM